MKVQILAAGSLKNGPEKNLLEQYRKRLTFALKIIEIDGKQSAKIPAEAYQKHLTSKDIVISLDEGGKNVTSRELATTLQNYAETGKRVSFIIGGADGIPEDIKKIANLSIAFGKATWPHLLVRALLVEQLYRAQQITSGHPYHRD